MDEEDLEEMRALRGERQKQRFHIHYLVVRKKKSTV